jgi:glycosyltransferase involved in cell wall biosynthesis
MKKILFNALQFAPNGAGISTYAFELLSQLLSSYGHIHGLIRAGSSGCFLQSDKLTTYNKPIKSSASRIVVEQIKLLKLLNGYDLIHYPDYAIPILASKPCVATINDLSFYATHNKYTKAQILTKRLLMAGTIMRAKKLICISNFTAKELVKYYPQVEQSRIEVIHNGIRLSTITAPINRDYLRNEFTISKAYMLYVGTLAPAKNLVRLIEAFSLLKKQGYDYQLVLAGKKGWMYDGIYQAVRRLGLEAEVVFTGYVSQPQLETLARHKPVLVSNAASIPEIVADAGLYCDPFDVEDIATKAAQLLKDDALKRLLVDRGAERVAKFSWEAAANATNRVYEKVLSG